MQKISAMLAVAVVMAPFSSLAVTQQKPAKVGIGFDWGVSYEFFDAKALEGYAQQFELALYTKEKLGMAVYFSHIKMILEDGGLAARGDVGLAGILSTYNVNSLVDAGIVVGGADVDLGGAEVRPFALIFGTINVLESENQWLTFDMDLDLGYRFLDVADFSLNGAVVQSLNAFAVTISIGVAF